MRFRDQRERLSPRLSFLALVEAGEGVSGAAGVSQGEPR